MVGTADTGADHGPPPPAEDDNCGRRSWYVDERRAGKTLDSDGGMKSRERKFMHFIWRDT
jgi:hypothetical protein